jgi:uncharacterized membrane protein YhaH (DUF805 family)
MSDTWYYADQGRRSEPVTTQGLKSALARMPNGRDVLVWRDGFPDWKRAGDLPELWSQPGPPPPPSAYPAGPAPMPAQTHQAASSGDLKHLWFGFNGRVNRAKYWLVNIVNIVGLSVLAGVILGVFGFEMVAWLILGVLYLVVLVSAVAICIKRLHDRNKPGWWAAVFIGLPVVLGGLSTLLGNELLAMVFGLGQFAVAIWGLIELGILRGTVGPNQYGEDPLEGRTA